jgi:hypothetical protein
MQHSSENKILNEQIFQESVFWKADFPSSVWSVSQLNLLQRVTVTQIVLR